MDLLKSQNIVFKKRQQQVPSNNASVPGKGPEMITVQDIYKEEKYTQYFIVMDQFGDSLRVIHDKLYGQFSFKTTIQIGIQIINVLERLHNYGFVFNDLKPDNIVVGNQSIENHTESELAAMNHQLWKLRLIDFGLVSKYRDSEGVHIK
jgi:serine/threonine protein kinase